MSDQFAQNSDSFGALNNDELTEKNFDSLANHTSHYVDSVARFLEGHFAVFGFDRIQAFVFLFLIVFLAVAIAGIVFSWRIYAPIIVSFSELEKREGKRDRTRRTSEKID